MGGAGGPVDDCPGVAFTSSGALDVALRSISVSGAVTLNGATLPDESGARGSLLFTGNAGRSTATVSLKTTGGVSYALRLPPGTYDVSYLPNAALCTATKIPAVPCGGGVLHHGLALAADGVLDIDIPAVEVSGAVTLQGAPLPSQTGDRGAIRFAPAGAPAALVPLGTSGAVSYRTRLVPGNHDVSFQGIAAGCTQATASALPCNAGPLKLGVALTSPGVLDLDIPVVNVTGSVTVNGAALPSESADRGALTFSLTGGGAAASRAFGSSGAVSYAMTLLPGSYSVALAANPALCQLAQASSVPCVGGKLMPSAVALTSDGVFDVDVRAVTVTGSVTSRGGALSAPGADLGRLSFSNDVGGAGTTRPLRSSDAGSYQLRVLAGRYDVAYVANPALCAQPVTGAALPCNGGRLSSAVALMSDGVLDVDVPSVTVTGSVTVNGAPMPAASAARGALLFATANGSGVTTPSFGTSGAVAFGVSLFPGSYAVSLAANTQLCGAGNAAPAVPCVGGAVVPSASLRSDGVLDVDIRAVSVTGSVTLDGAPLPAASLDRGSLTFTRVAGEGGGAGALPLAASAASSYAVTVVAGKYVVTHAANPAQCNGSTAPAIPCASQVVLGCVR